MTITYSARVADRPAGDRRLSGELAGPEGSNCVAGSADFACGNTSEAGLPLLNIGMSADRETVRPGDVIVHTITAQNVGAAAYLGATLTDELSQTLDDATYNNDASATTGAVSYDESRLNWTGDIAAGETVTVTYSSTVKDTGAATICWSARSRLPGAARTARLRRPRPAGSPLRSPGPIANAPTASSWRT
ncbi:isopeptide-forming domain-containing fimbrial protein [Streptosporangium lutulentum]